MEEQKDSENDCRWELSPREYVINDERYCELVYKLIDLTQQNLYFVLLIQNEKCTTKKKYFWTKADPNLDTWILIVGKVPDVINSVIRAKVSGH